MASSFTPTPLTEQVGTARTALGTAVHTAFDAVCGMRGAEDAVAFAIVAEEILRSAQALTVAAAAGLVEARAHEEYQLRSAAAVLNVVCRVGSSEAKRRVHLAGQITPRVTLHGEPLDAKLPDLAAAVRAGEVTAASAHRVAATDAKIATVVTEEARENLIGGLLEIARTEDDAFVNVCAKRSIEDAHPDGTEPTDAILRMRQGITFGIERDGLIPFSGCMTRLQYETVLSTIGTFTNPRLQQPNTGCDEAMTEGENTDTASDVSIDPGDGGDPILVNATGRTRPQLLLDGLVATCELASRTGRLPRNGGTRPTVIVTVPFDELREQLGTAETTFAGPVPAGRIRQLACDAGILPVVLGSDGQVLDAGAEKRLVEGPLRKVLTARDGGCALPHCDMPATWADAHHVIHWADGGPTTLENTVLLCRQHHTLVHHSAWKIVMRDDIPFFVPPWQIDPHQTPRRNHRHRRPRAEQRFRPRKPAPPPPSTDTGNRRT
ncbi:DUF222 domain-containing protein [Microbacteriaceae bacterium VKM Ac-2854]|nr:DUF222 domain-containing protein [Microbacteriaceae bacterium VKM Ac-2854]